jgi:leucyl aminopeptidase
VEFSIKSGNPEKQRTACVVVGVFEAKKLSLPAELLDKTSNGYISEIIRRGDMEGKAGTTLLLHKVPGTLCERVLLVGLGKEKAFHEKEFCTAIKTTVKTLKTTGAIDASIFITELPVKKQDTSWRIRQAAILANDAAYLFDQFKSKNGDSRGRFAGKNTGQSACQHLPPDLPGRTGGNHSHRVQAGL